MLNNSKSETLSPLNGYKNSPINWFSWGEKAFKKAKEENKSIFLSITDNYSQWSLLMEEESFSKQDVIELLNERFIAIRVDAQIHPELSKFYQKVHKIINRSRAGFPLSIFLTENLEPFYAGSYISLEAQKELLGFEALLRVVSNKYITDHDTLVAKGKEVLENINPKKQKIEATKLDLNILKTITIHTNSLVDKKYGGFGDNPKFPNSSILELVLDTYELTKEQSLLDVATLSLNAIYKGNLYDKKDGAFYTYTTDNQWQEPYLLKTTYDNALLIKTYLRAYLITDNQEYKNIAFKSINFMIENMSESKLFFAKIYEGKDIDKNIITSWNSMMISALFMASTIDKKYQQNAIESLDRLLEKLYNNNTLCHTQEAKTEAFLEDYAYLGDCLISAYQATLDESYLIKAIEFANILIEKFYKYGKWNFSNGLYKIEEEISDVPYPSSLAVAGSLLMSISSLVDTTYKKFVFKTLEINSYNLMRQPISSPKLTQLLIRYLKDDIIIKSNEKILTKLLNKRSFMNYPYVLFKTTLDKEIVICNSTSSLAKTTNPNNIKELIEKHL